MTTELTSIKASELTLGQHAWYWDNVEWVVVGLIDEEFMQENPTDKVGVEVCTAWECGIALRHDELVYPVPGPPNPELPPTL